MKGVPEFWLTIFKNVELLQEMVQEHDEAVLKSLCDIQTIRDLTEDAVRDILRNKTNDHGLEVVEMGQISDMSGLNDAFNSTICSLKVKAKFSGKGPSAAAAGEGEGAGGAGIYSMDE